MTETRFTWQWLFVVAGFGVIVGLAFGLMLGWIVLPAASSAVDVSALNPTAQNDYLILVANSYAYDDDLPKAKERLALLKDSNINSRVERLAKALATRQDPNAANMAELAVALGSKDSSLQVLAASVANNPGGSPTKFAQLDVPPTPTLEPSPEATEVPPPSETPTLAPTATKVKVSQTAAPKNTSKPEPTSVPQAATALLPDFKPSFPDQWWKGVQFVAASVATGQQYWRLKSALYCDVLDQRNNCPDLPGGVMDHSIYVSVLNPDGSCANATIKHETNTGDTTPLEQKNVLYPWNSCASTDYEWNMYGEGNDIWIDSLPSDRLNGMCLCNRTPPPGGGIMQGHAHVRYFLIFQLTTR
jgi:hypothetical protein